MGFTLATKPANTPAIRMNGHDATYARSRRGCLNDHNCCSLTDFNEYFRTVSTPRAVHDIRSAKVSPWVIHLSESGVELLGRMSNEQIVMIKPLIDTEFWVRVFMKSKEETDEVEQMCTQAGL